MDELELWEEREGPDVLLEQSHQDPLPRRGSLIIFAMLLIGILGGGVGLIVTNSKVEATPPRVAPPAATSTPAPKTSETPVPLPSLPVLPPRVVVTTHEVVKVVKVYVTDKPAVVPVPSPKATVRPTPTPTPHPTTPSAAPTGTPVPLPTGPATPTPTNTATPSATLTTPPTSSATS
jgi:hypothetical protein